MSENVATPTAAPPAAPAAAQPAKKLRSCVVCRHRKVRCDKQSPCSNCRRAGIACTVPSNDRPPRWARRLERLTNSGATASPVAAPEVPDPGATQVLDRLRTLESLVKELSGQLEQANAAGGSSNANSPGSAAQEQGAARTTSSTPSSTSGAAMQKHFGRLVLKDQAQSRYVSSGFWSRVSDELDGLKQSTQELADSDSDDSSDDSPGTTPSTREHNRAPADRSAFLFHHNLSNTGGKGPDLRQFRPLPSQIPFLLNTFSENVNFILQIMHMPTVHKMVREVRGDASTLSPSSEAVLFSTYYAAVVSMDDEDVTTNFGSAKADLALKFRLGLEHALAAANFLITPNILLVQAFTTFLFLVRLQDSPKFVWMMTGLAIRMAQSLGLQRDGSHFPNLSPFEVETRRRVWAALCLLDIRASENQGSDLTISLNSFDTQLPLNINDDDISPDSKEMPKERDGLTDMSFPIITYELCHATLQMMGPGGVRGGGGPSLDEQSQMLDAHFERFKRGYLRYTDQTDNIAYWVASTSVRLVVGKMTLLIYLPALFSSPNERFSDEIRNKLLVAAIEVAEYNHTLNTEPRARQWRWIYQTYAHWYAIVYMLLEIARRPWSPVVERAWTALQSSWLFPDQHKMDKSLPIWVPLRRLMAKARKHRRDQLERLRGDPSAVQELELKDRDVPAPGSSGPFPEGKAVEGFLEHWRSLVKEPPSQPVARQESADKSTSQQPSPPPAAASIPQPYTPFSTSQQGAWGAPNMGFGAASQVTNPAFAAGMTSQLGVPPTGSDWMGFGSWLFGDPHQTADVFTDVDVDMTLDDGSMNWNNWLESAAVTELEMASQSHAGWAPIPPDQGF